MKKRTCYLMGTVIQLEVAHKAAEELLAEASKRLADYEQRFSANDPSSQLMLVNHQAGKQPVKVDPDLFELIKLGKYHSQAQDSCLNIAIGPLIQEWRIGFKDAKKPTAARIKELLPLIDPDKILLDETASTVYLAEKGMAIDLGAIAKGYFADRIIAYFKEAGATAGAIDLGGNLLVFGEHPAHEDGFWRVGIQHPSLPRGSFALALKVKNQSVVTSGIYERTFTVAGITYHHIFDRHTGYPMTSETASLTVISEQSVAGEIWTTRLFGKKPQTVLTELAQQTASTGIVMTKDEQLLYSKALTDRIIGE